MPLIWSEYNAAYDNEVAVTDSIYMGPGMATTIAQCDGLTKMMSYWSFSDVFEEQGVVKTALLRRLWIDCRRRHSQAVVLWL